MATYSLREVRKLAGVPEAVIRSLRRGGHLAPAVDTDDAEHFSEADLVVLRVVAALRAARVPAGRIARSLARLRAVLPIATGRTKPVLRDAGATSGVAVATPMLPLPRIDRRRQAEQHFDAALALEESDVASARTRYLAALKAHRHHREARINLGRLLHLDGQLEEAERIYRAAKFAHALLSFNLALLLEDMNREDEAVSAYREALGLDPEMHDVHYNLSRLHERAQRPREALYHLLAYRRHIARANRAQQLAE